MRSKADTHSEEAEKAVRDSDGDGNRDDDVSNHLFAIWSSDGSPF